MRTKRKRNKHGLQYTIQGNLLVVNRVGASISMAYLKWMNPDYITEEMLQEGLTLPFEFGCETVPTSKEIPNMMCDAMPRLPKDVNELSRLNKYGVRFDIYGADFMYDGKDFRIGLPKCCDISHAYTPELLISILWGHGTYCHKSDCWKVFRGDRNERSKELIWVE